jgi:hypothetical protein
MFIQSSISVGNEARCSTYHLLELPKDSRPTAAGDKRESQEQDRLTNNEISSAVTLET